MSTKQTIKIGPLKKYELEEAASVVRLASGTFLGQSLRRAMADA